MVGSLSTDCVNSAIRKSIHLQMKTTIGALDFGAHPTVLSNGSYKVERIFIDNSFRWNSSMLMCNSISGKVRVLLILTDD